MTRLRPVLLCAAIVTASACASSGFLEVPTPAEIPALEARVGVDPGDVQAGLRLAAAYRDAERYDDAGRLVATLLDTSPEDPGLLAMSGLIHEDLGELDAARVAYRAALDTNAAGALREEVERRLEIVRAAELRAGVVAALEREEEVAQTTPDPATVGIFPFLYDGQDPSWEPLALALPEMLATDLGVTGRLQVLERIQIQALLNEMALSASGRVDEATAARSGRLLGSGHIVQGRFRIDGGTRIGIDAAVVEVLEPGVEQVDPLTGEDTIEQLFALEKRLALDLHEEIGIQLTPAERARINERHTESVQALLEFGRGIAAENSGDYAQAQQHFDAAVAIDPAFQLAASRAQTAATMVGAGVAAFAGRFSSMARQLSLQRQAVHLLRNAPANVQQRVLTMVSPQKRAVIAEVLGQDRVGQVILLELIFRGPGGSP